MCNYTGNQSKGVQVLDVIFSDCVVDFGPADDWEGEFGFDWVRGEGTCFKENINGSISTDLYNYQNIVGYYYLTDPDTPNSNEVFLSNHDYKRKLFSEYQKLKYYDLTEKKFLSYHSPFISLFYSSIIDGKSMLPTIMLDNVDGKNVLKAQCKTDARLMVAIHAKNIDKIEFEYDKKRLKVEPSVIREQDIKPKQEIIISYLYDDYEGDFDECIDIKAIAYYKKGAIVNDKNEEWVSKACAGQLNVVRCVPRIVNIRFVMILSNFNKGIQKPSAINIKQKKEALCKYLAQANVIPKFDDIGFFPENKQEELKRILNKYKHWDKSIGYSIQLENKSTLLEELEELYLGKSTNLFGNRYVIFIINERANKGGEAFISGHTSVVFQKSSAYSTPCHELLHCLGLHHSFSNDSTHTFKKNNTSNIMDYSDGRYTLWKWQWKQINDALKPKSNGR